MMNYSNLAFTDPIRVLQDKNGSRPAYARMEKQVYREGLGDAEKQFIEQRDSFYMATIGENGYPYVQFRGGPKGFLKMLDAETLAFIDFRGNMQYISVGNLQTNNKVALILLDYPTRTRLKIYAEAKSIALEDAPQLAAQLSLEDYKYRPERILQLTIKAFDWKCQQHITPRYTAAELEDILAPQKAYIQKLEQEIEELRKEKA